MNNTTAISSSTQLIDTTAVVIIVVYSILAVVCIFANSLICYVIVTRKTTDGSLKYYVFSLALTDILVGIACIPLFLSKEYTWHAKWNILESFSTGFDIFLGSCSIMHLCLMAFDRVMSVTKPMLHRTKLRQRKTALGLIIIPWLFGIICVIIPFTQGSKDFEHYSSIVIIYLIPIPCIFIFVCYTIIYLTIWKRNKRWQRDNMSLYRVEHIQMTKTLLYVIVVFVICWIPFVIYHSLPTSAFQPLSVKASHWFYYSVKLLAYSNSICNSIIYAVLNPLFRKGMDDVLRHCFPCERCYEQQGISHDENGQQSNNISSWLSSLRNL